MVHIACGNCLPGSEEPNCHLSTSSQATTSEGIGRQLTRPRRRRCYNGAKRAQDRTHSVVHLFKLSVQVRNINIFRLISKRKVKNVHFNRSFFPRDRRSNKVLFSRKPTTAVQSDSDGSEFTSQLSHIFNISFRYFLYFYRYFFFI